MKKLLFVAVMLLSAIALFSCIEPKDTHTVTFVTEEGNITETLAAGSLISFPKAREKENYIFDGWYYDEALENPVSKNARADRDLTLYPKYEYDYKTVTNDIFSKYIEMNVEITAVSYNTRFGMITEEKYSTGSGVIIDEEIGYYYMLTNNHVVEAEDGYSSVRYEVTDCYGTKMREATLVASSAEYDLAVIRFRKGAELLYVAEFADTAPSVGDVVIALGQPGGLDNAVTYGNMLRLQSVSSEKSESSVAFPVICHNAPLQKGSSGGVLLSDRLQIIGINYAVATDVSTGEVLGGLAIPTEKVVEFLEQN